MESNNFEDWKALPGETVMLYEHTAEQAAKQVNLYGTEFQVKKLTAGKHYPEEEPGHTWAKERFEASTPYRHCVYSGASPEEALGAMLMGWGLLCRAGSVNPNAPGQQGAPIIQHAIDILTERLSWQVEQRRAHIAMSGYFDGPLGYGAVALTTASEGQDDSKAHATRKAKEAEQAGNVLQATARDNEIISALATAISSLARVKDL